LKYGVPLESILEANTISEDDFLSVGQELIIPLTDGVDWPTPTATSISSSELTVITHTIRAGDTLSEISVRYDTTIRDLVEANKLSGPGEILRVGQVLVIPPKIPTSTPVTPTSSPTQTPIEVSSPSPTPADPTPTPRFALPAPVSLSPPDDDVITGDSALLNWASIGVLDDDMWYMVRLRTARPGESEITREVWLKATAWRVPDDLMPEPGTMQRYRWDVTVVRRIGEESDEVLSPPSQILTFRWER
jgi:LysM repeat protein